MLTTRLIAIFLMIISVWISSAQAIRGVSLPNTVRFKNINSANGLPGETIKTIAKDRRGLIWLGVEFEGLACYDGRNFDLYDHDVENASSLSSNIVKCIVDDGKGNLWVGTANGLNLKSLNLLDHPANKFRQFHANDSSGLPGNDINSLKIDSKERILIGTNMGLCLYRGDGQFELIDIYNQTLKIQHIYESSKGEFYLSTNLGVAHLDSGLSVIKFWDKETLLHLSNLDVNCIEKGPDGKLWIGSRGGIYIFDPSKGIFDLINDYIKDQPMFRSIGINKIHRDNTGRMWVGTISEGLYIFSQSKKGLNYVTHSQLETGGYAGHQVRAIYQDDDDFIWIGTKNKGFYQFTYESETFGLLKSGNNLKHSLNDDCVLSMAEDKNHNLYFGTLHGGLNVFRAATGDFIQYQHDNDDIHSLINDRVEALEIDRNGHVWIGSVEGVGVFYPEQNKFINQKLPSVRTLKIDHNDNVWVGTRNGLYFSENLSDKFTPMVLYDSVGQREVIYTLFIDRAGYVWIGTGDDGLMKYDPENKRLAKYFAAGDQGDNHLPAAHIRSLYEDQEGVIWIGTKLNGLFRFDQNGITFSRIKPDELSLSVFSILSDSQSNLWLATDEGIIKFSKTDGSVERFGKQHGLQGEAFINSAYYKASNGLLFFGGNGGMNYFDPTKIKKKAKTFQVNVKSIRSSGIIAPKTKDGIYTFNYGDHLSFDFFLSDYSSPKENSFFYRLAGVDKDWVNSEKRNQVSYANLSPGTYILKIRGISSDGFESQNVAEINFRVLPPWWLTSFAKVCYVLLGFLLLYVLYNVLTYRALKQHELNVLNMEKEQTEKLTQMKLRFFTNISHELRTPLTLMLPSAEKIIEFVKSIPEAQKHSRTIMKSIRTLLTLIDELIQFRKIEDGKLSFAPRETNISSLVSDVFDEFESIAQDKQLNYQSEIGSGSIRGFIDQEIVKKILRNLISNAIKYTQKEGQVVLKMEMEDILIFKNKSSGMKSDWEGENRKFIKFKISDTGIGISEEELHHIFDRFYRTENNTAAGGSGIGLDLVKGLVDLHQGKIEVTSQQGVGSTFTLHIPIDPYDLRIAENPISSAFQFYAPTMEEHVSINEQKHREGADHILIVEDDDEIRAMLYELFSEQYQVTLASDGSKGLEKAQEFPQVNLIITDIMMPELDGMEFCKAIKGSVKTSHIPMLMLTAKTAPADEISGLGVGANAYVAKPFYPNVLKARVESLLENQKLVKAHFSKELQLNPIEVQLPDSEKDILRLCIEAIERNINNEYFGVEELSREVGISRTYLFRKLKYLVDLGPLELIYSAKLNRARTLLETNAHTISEVAYMCGFSSPNSFATTFKKHYKVSPSEYMKRLSKQAFK